MSINHRPRNPTKIRFSPFRCSVLGAVLALGGCGGDSPTEPPPPAPPEMTEVIEALFFGVGPLGELACPRFSIWSGFPRGTEVEVLVSTTVSLERRSAIAAAVPLVEAATLGEITAVFSVTEDPDPVPDENQVVVITHPAPSQEGCGSDIGCTIPIFQAPGVLRASRAVMPENQTIQAYVHDAIGHGVLGMCHINGFEIGGPELSLMSGGPGVFSGAIASTITDLDREALRAVYGSSLNPGADAAAFRAEGLINP